MNLVIRLSFDLPAREYLRYPRKRLKKDGKFACPTGLKLAHRRKFQRIIPAGSLIKVRSKYEKVCAELLEKNKIRFQYEPLILLEGRQYRPDFYLPDYDLFLEICGYGHMPFYNDRIAQKQKIYEKCRLKAVFILYRGRGSLEKIIKAELAKFDVEFME